MSTRIEAGRIWAKTGGLNKLVNELLAIRETAIKRIDAFYWKEVSDRIVRVLKQQSFPELLTNKDIRIPIENDAGPNEEPKKKSLKEIYDEAQEWVEKQMREDEKSQMAWNCYFDCRFEVQIFERKGRAGFLLYPIYHKRDMYRDILPGKEYGYWNNSDPEEGVSKQEWRLREQEWDRAVPYSLSDRGCCFTIVRQEDISLARYKIMNTEKDVDKERKRRTKLIEKAIMKEIGAEYPKKFKKSIYDELFGHIKPKKKPSKNKP